MTDLFDRVRVIDVDTHLTEPADTWTARVPLAIRDQVPHIERIEARDCWVAGGQRLGAPGFYSMAGYDGLLPGTIPETYDDIAPAMYDSKARLEFLDAEGIYAQVLYPNVGGFGNGYFLRLGDRDVVAACVRAYNDFLTDWCSADPDRLVAICALPFWDLDLAVAELQRCLDNGHRAVNFCNQPQAYGLPELAEHHWDPIWALAQEAGVPISFHVGGGGMGTLMTDPAHMGLMTNFAKVSSLIFLDNMRCIADLIFGGVCHRFPNLDFVSVESGVGWIPGALEAFDWQWRNGGVVSEHPDYDLLPSEYFRRQIYGCFWFEEGVALDAIARYPDNLLFETDYPHPTCQHPGPRTPAQRPRDYASKLLAGIDDAVGEKVLHGNAARLYRVH
jgi:predicted TIM-barrel fold metal-dependent hydrolase